MRRKDPSSLEIGGKDAFDGQHLLVRIVVQRKLQISRHKGRLGSPYTDANGHQIIAQLGDSGIHVRG